MKPMGGRTWKYWPASGRVFFRGVISLGLEFPGDFCISVNIHRNPEQPIGIKEFNLA